MPSLLAAMTFPGAGATGTASIHDFTTDSIEGTPVPLAEFKGMGLHRIAFARSGDIHRWRLSPAS